MNLSFESSRLQRLCNERTAMAERWGAPQARQLAQSLYELDALENLRDVAALPHVEVVRTSAERITVHGPGGVRIVLRVDDDGEARSGDMESITSVVVVDLAVNGARRRRRDLG